MKIRDLAIGVAVNLITCGALAAPAALLAVQPPAMGTCGTMYAGPFAERGDGLRKRVCGRPVPRNYTPKNTGMGFKALDIESEACFVPDNAYRLLDEIVDEVRSRVVSLSPPQNDDARIARALAISKATGDVLAERGFGLFIPTDTIGDALTAKSQPDETPRHTVDCDTSSLILLTAAEALNMKAALVEITLPGGAGHNFVRWEINAGRTIDWDTNGRAQCLIPPINPKFQGRSMSEDETVAYLLSVRAERHSKEGNILAGLQDYRTAMEKFPTHPTPVNNFIWAVATKRFPEREAYKNEAFGLVGALLDIDRSPNYLDTAACIAAYAGDFEKAAAYEAEALKGAPNNTEFSDRLAQFRAAQPRDCTGAD